MSTVEKLWNFTGNAQGLTDQGLSSRIVFEYVPGAFVWFDLDAPMPGTNTEAAQGENETFEDWGVPDGGIVTFLEIKEYKKKIFESSSMTGLTLDGIYVVDSEGDSYSDLPLAYGSLGTSVDLDWVTKTGDVTAAMPAGTVLHSSACALRIVFSGTGGYFQSSVVGFDDILLEISYSVGPSDDLVIEDCLHDHYSQSDEDGEDVVLSTCYDMPINDSSHVLFDRRPTLEDGGEVMVPNSCRHVLSSDQVALVTEYDLSINDCSHALSCDTRLSLSSAPRSPIHGKMFGLNKRLVRLTSGRWRLLK